MDDPELLTLIRSSFIADSKKAELERLLAELPPSEEGQVLAKLNAYLEEEIKDRAERFKSTSDGFETAYTEADAAFVAAKERLEKDLEAKLEQLSDDDIDGREKLWEAFDRELEQLEQECETKIITAAAAALIGTAQEE